MVSYFLNGFASVWTKCQTPPVVVSGRSDCPSVGFAVQALTEGYLLAGYRVIHLLESTAQAGAIADGHRRKALPHCGTHRG